MITLAFDTSSGGCSVAVAQDADLLGHIFEKRQRGHAEVILPMISRVLNDAALQWPDIDRLAVTVGPGTFTGVRIGISVARGLSLALGIPVAGFSTLAAIASGCLPLPAGAEGGDTLMVAHDARRGELYVQAFDVVIKDGGPEIVVASAPALKSLEEPGIISPSDRRIWLAGSGADLLAGAIRPSMLVNVLADAPIVPNADVLLTMARNTDWHDLPGNGTIMPIYLRAPDAKLPNNMPATAPDC